jgi:hypothetical protein
MKKLSFISIMLALALAFGLAFVSCDNDTTSGGNTPGGNTPSGGASTFTLTNIPSQYNGKYAYLQAISASGKEIHGFQSSTSSASTLVSISNGRAIFPLAAWDSTSSGAPYNGTELANVAVLISNQATAPHGVQLEEIARIYFMNVSFTNGSATKSWADGTVQ